MYKILIKYRTLDNGAVMWQEYGEVTSSTTDTGSTFEEFSTEDTDILESKLEELDEKYGYEDIRVVKDVDVTHNISVTNTSSAGTPETETDTKSTIETT